MHLLTTYHSPLATCFCMKTTLEISGSRLAENFRAVESVAGADATVLAVVKADAYGHGAALCTPVLVEAGARWLGVSDAEEGVALRGALGQVADAGATRVLVMCGMEPRDAGAMLANGLTPVVWTPEHVDVMEQVAQAAGSTGQRTAVHLEIDSGMSRQGALPGEPLRRVVERLAASRRLFCEGVLTHLANAEEVGSAMTAMQGERFAAGLKTVFAAGLRPRWLHMANTSALDEASSTDWLRELVRRYAAGSPGLSMMVRTGLAMYGHCLPLAPAGEPASEKPASEKPGSENPGSGKPGSENSGPGHPSSQPVLKLQLQPVLRWKTCVVGLREIAADEHVGYGATWTAQRPTRLALLPVGYADGFRRGASTGLGDGWVMIGDRRAPMAGRVSMNLTTVDVTDLSEVEVGSEVTLLGPGVTAEDHARWTGTIHYEILCGLRGQRVLV